jgi:hypothetical protein
VNKAGDLLMKLDTIANPDATLGAIKALLDPFNAEGFIKFGNPISMLPELGYSKERRGATTIEDYNIADLNEIFKGDSAKKAEVLSKYKEWYSYFPVEAAISHEYGSRTLTFDQWANRGYVSEYFRAAYFAHINGIVTLALLYDILEGNLTERGSLLSAFITGARPVRIDPRPLNNASWGRIGGKLNALFIGAVLGKFNSDTVRLIAMGGGARKTRKAKGTRRQRNRPRRTHKKMAKRRKTRRA